MITFDWKMDLIEKWLSLEDGFYRNNENVCLEDGSYVNNVNVWLEDGSYVNNEIVWLEDWSYRNNENVWPGKKFADWRPVNERCTEGRIRIHII